MDQLKEQINLLTENMNILAALPCFLVSSLSQFLKILQKN